MSLRTWGLWIATLMFGTVCPAPAGAQCDPSWLPSLSLPGPDAEVYAIASHDDGSGPAIYAAGRFTAAGRVVANCVARWNGQAWSTLGSGMNGEVHGLLVYRGELVAAGDFTTAGGVTVNHIARWDGTDWSPLGAGMNGRVSALAVFSEDLIAVGSFTTVDGQPGSAARWDGDSWTTLGWGEDTAVAVFQGGLYSGGSGGLSKWLGGSQWQPIPGLAPAPLFRVQIDQLEEHDGELVAAGQFKTADGAVANNIAGWNGVRWRTYGTGFLDPSPYPDLTRIRCLTRFNGELVAGGGFTSADGATVYQLAHWDGATWQPFPQWRAYKGEGSGSVRSATIHQGQLIVGGDFNAIEGTTVLNITAWDGVSWRRLGSGTTQYVSAITTFGGDFVLGGVFRSVDPDVNYLARWDGANLKLLGDTATQLNGIVRSLLSKEGELYASGLFTMAGSVEAKNIAAWDGSGWRSLGSGLGTGARVMVTWHGDLIAGGAFTDAGGSPAACIARWDGADWSQLGGGVGGISSPTVEAMVEFRDQLVVGGRFTTAGGVQTNNIAAWDGVSWQSLGSGVNSFVYALAVFNDELIAGGLFTTAGGQPIKYIAAWNGSTWRPIGTLNSSVYALALHEHTLIAGGLFDRVDGITMDRIAAWDGLQWRGLGLGLGGGRIGQDVRVNDLNSSDGVLSVGGTFTTAGGGVSGPFAQWACRPCPADLNSDGVVDFTDYLEFLNLYDGLDPRADLNGDGVIDFGDYLEFLNHYDAGC